MNQGFHKPRLGLWLFIALLAFNLWAYDGGPGRGSDGYYVYLSALSVIEQGEMNVEESGYSESLGTTRTPQGVDGKLYPASGVGWVASLLPTLALGKLITLLPLATTKAAVTNFFAGLIMPLAGAMLGFLLYAFLLRLGVGRGVSLLIAIAASLTTPLWEYSASASYSEILLSLSLFASFYFLLRYRQSSELHWLFLSSAALGYSITIKFYSLILLIPLLIYLWLILPHPRKKRPLWLAIYLIPFLCGVFMVMIVNLLHFGAVFNTGYSLEVQTRSIPPLVGIFGLLLSPGAGLLFYFPASILATVGFVHLLRRHRAEAIFILTTAIVLVVFFGRLWYWSGDPCYGPRYILPLIPLAMIPIGPLLERLRKPTRITWVLIFSLLGLFAVLPGILLSWNFEERIIPAGGIKYYLPECSPIYTGWRTVVLTTTAGVGAEPQIVTYANGPWQLTIPPQPVGSFWYSPLYPESEFHPSVGKAMLAFGIIIPIIACLSMLILVIRYRKAIGSNRHNRQHPAPKIDAP